MNDPIVLDDEILEAEIVESTDARPATQYDEVVARIMARIGKPEVASTKLKILIYGEPGVGKTTLASTAPSPLFIDVERGARTLKGKDVDVLEYVSIEQIEAVVRYLRDGHSAFDQYETIVFDSLSEMQRRLIDAQLQRVSEVTKQPQYKADWDIYNINTQRLRSLMSAFRDIDRNLIVTAQARQDKDDSTGIMMFRPDLTPKLAATVAGLFDIVGYLRINSKGERLLQVAPSKTVLAKTRVTNLPKEIANPSWDSLNK